MSSERVTNLAATLSRSVEHVSNCVTQFNSCSIEIDVLVTIQVMKSPHRNLLIMHSKILVLVMTKHT